MPVPYAEVIGDPIAQSKSPLIHGQWLRQLGIEGDYRATRVSRRELGSYLAKRRSDPDWRGCNVTIPHKEAVLPLLGSLAPAAAAIGAVNCITRVDDGLKGANTDVDGVAEALKGARIEGSKAVVIGGGGGARALVRYLLDGKAQRITILLRDPAKAAGLVRWDPVRVKAVPLQDADAALAGAVLIANASPLGMDGQPDMSTDLLASLGQHAAGTLMFDMVYKPLETRFLAIGRANGAVTADGLEMLIGQARAAFSAFFGCAPPPDDGAVRRLLTA